MNEPISVQFGEYVKILRLERKLALTKAAKRMGMTVQKLCDIEAGRRYTKKIPLKLVQTVAIAYDVSIASIIKNTETSIHNEKTVADLLNEILPSSRMAELLSAQLLQQTTHYSAELESTAKELHEHIRNVHVLVKLMRKRHFNTDKTISILESE